MDPVTFKHGHAEGESFLCHGVTVTVAKVSCPEKQRILKILAALIPWADGIPDDPGFGTKEGHERNRSMRLKALNDAMACFPRVFDGLHIPEDNSDVRIWLRLNHENTSRVRRRHKAKKSLDKRRWKGVGLGNNGV